MGSSFVHLIRTDSNEFFLMAEFLTRKFIVGHMLLDAITDLFFKMHLQSTVL